jgi:hypothetical protein
MGSCSGVDLARARGRERIVKFELIAEFMAAAMHIYADRSAVFL